MLVWMAVLAAVAVAAIVRITARPQPAGTVSTLRGRPDHPAGGDGATMSGWISSSSSDRGTSVPGSYPDGWSVGATVVGVVATVGVLAVEPGCRRG
ncbi:MAG: hypothetical protein R2694_15520 [Ilumatobacteraceae bacterium]